MWLATGVMCGITCAALFEFPFLVRYSVLFIAMSGMGLILMFRKRTAAALLCVFIVGCVGGFLRGSAIHNQLAGYESFYKKSVTVQGVVSEDIAMTATGEQRLQLNDVRIDGQKLPGKVWLQTKTRATIKRSDTVVFQGMLREGFGTLPATMHRAAFVAVHRSGYDDPGRDMRDWFATQIRKAIQEPEASLGIGYLVGQRSTLPEDLDGRLQLLGLTHVVVASGYNLTILVRFTRRLFARFSKYMACSAAVTMVGLFVMMTGASPSMTRAALVTGLSLLAWYVGRTVQPLVLLGLVGAVTSFMNPFYIWGDVGWYLSMLSFAGIMILSPLLKHYFFGENTQLNTVTGILFETMSAQLATLPLIAFIFGQYSPYALLANVLILPFVQLAMLLTFAAGIISICLPVVVPFVGMPANRVLEYMTGTVYYVARLPGAAGTLEVGLLALVAGYIGMIAACVYMWRRTRHNFGQDNIIV